MWNLIPQVFYDFIARVVPGAVLLVVTAITVAGPASAADFALKSPRAEKLFLLGPVSLWMLGAYLVGFLLSHLWEMTAGKLTKHRDEEYETRVQRECLTGFVQLQKALKRPTPQVAPESLPRVFVMRDQLRHTVPEEAARLLKLRAERRACQTLLLGCTTLGILNGVFFIADQGGDRIILEVLVAVAVVACIGGARRLQRHLTYGTTLSWLDLTTSGKLSIDKKNPSTRG